MLSREERLAELIRRRGRKDGAPPAHNRVHTAANITRPLAPLYGNTDALTTGVYHAWSRFPGPDARTRAVHDVLVELTRPTRLSTNRPPKTVSWVDRHEHERRFWDRSSARRNPSYQGRPAGPAYQERKLQPALDRLAGLKRTDLAPALRTTPKATVVKRGTTPA